MIGNGRDGDANLGELALLTRTAGAEVAGRLVQRRQALNASTFIGRGKLEQLKEKTAAEDANLVIFDDDLTPAQTRELERYLDVRVIDRSTLILDIFARHARTAESKIQVELAQLLYLLPRLTRMWTHLSRTGGGIGTRGPGETQLEVDRRRIYAKIAKLKEKLGKVRVERAVQREGRRGAYRVSLVGYTNAGKSTLFNALTRADVPVEDQLFATLDTTTRRLHVGDGQVLLLSDTVGFIRKLPHHLVASFRSTLEEVIETDLLVHVVDASSDNLSGQMAAVDSALEELVPDGTPRLLVFNKTDLVTDETDREGLRAREPEAIFCSALSRRDVESLRGRLVETWEAWRNRRETA
jgi:GTP-binding protein HflX